MKEGSPQEGNPIQVQMQPYCTYNLQILKVALTHGSNTLPTDQYYNEGLITN